MGLSGKQQVFLFGVQGVGIFFVAVFLAAYLGGLPTTDVLHILPPFRYTLDVVGAVVLALILGTIGLAVYVRLSK